MSWLASIIASIAEKVIEMLGGDLLAYLQKKQAEKKSQAQNQAAADASVQPLKDAKTGQEVSDASDSALDNF